jgi:hypothetical protein
MRARYYEPWTGRFISEDPAMDGQNWFAYCSNDPVNRHDPSGNSDYINSSLSYITSIGVLLHALLGMRACADASAIAAMTVKFQALFLAAWILGPNEDGKSNDFGFFGGVMLAAIGTTIGAAEAGMMNITRQDRIAVGFAYLFFLEAFIAILAFEESYGYLTGGG